MHITFKMSVKQQDDDNDENQEDFNGKVEEAMG